jgi:hypothetical protein
MVGLVKTQRCQSIGSAGTVPSATWRMQVSDDANYYRISHLLAFDAL